MSKPATICQLVKYKLIDTREGFVDTFNWMAQFLANLKGEDPEDDKLTVEISGAESEYPILKVKGEVGMKLKCGDDSNIVISEEKDDDGYYTIDVYYK